MEPGEVVTGLSGAYRIEAWHGEGSFGITYRASDVSGGAPVIVKELRIEKLDDWKALELFEREARVLASLSCPNIPAFHDFFACGGPTPLPVSAMSSYDGPEHLFLVLVQQFIEGPTLQHRIDRGQPLSLDEAEPVLRALLGALRHLHDRTPPLVHRDIKPGNVILSPGGQPYLVDFGAIQDRLKSAGSIGSTIVGTLGYMPLEQIRGDARPASDLYALGVTMIVALAGRPLSDIAFDDARGTIALDRALPHGTPKAIHAALDSMVAPLLGQRARSADEVLARIDALERPAPSPARNHPRLARLRIVLAAILTASGSLVALMGVTLVVAASSGREALYCGHPCDDNQSDPLTVGLLLLVVGFIFVWHFSKRKRRLLLLFGKSQRTFAWRDLRGIDLGKLELSQCDFDYCDLRGAKLDGSTFEQCHFHRADLRGAKLDASTFVQCEFVGAQLEEVTRGSTTFSQCDLTNTALSRALERNGASLEQFDFECSKFEGCDFHSSSKEAKEENELASFLSFALFPLFLALTPLLLLGMAFGWHPLERLFH